MKTDPFDDFRRIASERTSLIQNLREQGAIDLDIARGAGFNAATKTIRKGSQGGGSGTYIGEGYGYDAYGSNRSRKH